MLSSDTISAQEIIISIDDKLSGQLHVAIKMPDALACIELSGPGARTILSMGYGLNLDSIMSSQAQCARMHFARVALVIAATDEDQFDLYVDRTYSNYLQEWIANATRDPLTQVW